MLKNILRWLKASAVFAGVGAGIAAAFVSVMVVISIFLWGGPGPLSDILYALGFFGGFGALGGLGFAAAISVIGRVGQVDDRFPLWKSGLAGAIGMFLAPLIAIVVLGGLPPEPVLDFLGTYWSAVWWFAPLGGTLGIAIDRVAERSPRLSEGVQAELALERPAGSNVVRAEISNRES